MQRFKLYVTCFYNKTVPEIIDSFCKNSIYIICTCIQDLNSIFYIQRLTHIVENFALSLLGFLWFVLPTSNYSLHLWYKKKTSDKLNMKICISTMKSSTTVNDYYLCVINNSSYTSFRNKPDYVYIFVFLFLHVRIPIDLYYIFTKLKERTNIVLTPKLKI